MEALEELYSSTNQLQSVISEFKIGAATLDDDKPIEDQIKDTRNEIKVLRSRILAWETRQKMLQSQTANVTATPDDVDAKQKDLNKKISRKVNSSKTLTEGYEAKVVHSILQNGTEEDTEKIKQYFNKNVLLLELCKSLKIREISLRDDHLQLKLKYQKAIYDYKEFLKEQEAKKAEKLQETHPNVAKNKEKIDRFIYKIAITKKLITNLIAANFHKLEKMDQDQKSLFLDLLRKHKRMIDFETIVGYNCEGIGDVNEE